MARIPDEVTEAERSVLEVLWSHAQGATVREIVLKLYGRHEHSLHGGVKSFLDRLIEKGYVAVDKSGFSHRFSSTVSREAFVGSQLRHLAQDHFAGSLSPLLVALVDQIKLSKTDRAAIERIIENIRD